MKYWSQLANRDKRLFVGGIVLSIIASMVNVIIPLRVKELLEGQAVGQTVLMIACLFLVNTSLMAIGTYMIAQVGERYVANLRQIVMEHVIDLPVSFFDEAKSGEVTHRVINDLTSIRSFMTVRVAIIASNVVTVIGAFAMLFWLDWKLSLLLLISMVMLIAIFSTMSNMGSKFTAKLNVKTGLLSGALSEFVQQIRLLKFSSGQDYAKSTLRNMTEQTFDVAKSVNKFDRVADSVAMLLFLVEMMIVFGYGGLRVQAGTLAMSTLIAFLLYLFQLFTPFSQVGMFMNELAKTKASLSYINEVLAQPTECSGQTVSEKTLTFEHLTFENVSFGYNEDTLVCKNVSLSFSKNKKIALVGPSGSGKSTILSLIERLYDVTSGDIQLDGISIQDIPLKQWRQCLAVVSQDTALLSTTVRDNLTLGLSYDVNDDDLHEALQKAQLLDAILALPAGLDTEIGERGTKLSGGQQQRLQIARAFLKKAPIVLMDEATSNLDSQTEKLVSDAMTELSHQKISIVVAHRLATIVDADSIYFIENGVVTGCGTHEVLKQTHERYATFVKEQLLG